MSTKNQHVVPRGNDWAVKREGADRATTVVPTQREAIEIAHEIAQNNNSELFMHGRDGRIRDRLHQVEVIDKGPIFPSIRPQCAYSLHYACCSPRSA